MPFLVETNMLSSAVKANFLPLFVATPDAYARAAVRWIGHGPMSVPNVAHQLQWWLSSLVPEFLLDSCRLRQHLQQRAIFRRLGPWRASQGNSRDRVN